MTALWGGSPAMLTDLADELEAEPSLDASAMGMTIYGWTAAAPELVDRAEARAVRPSSSCARSSARPRRSPAAASGRTSGGDFPRTAPDVNYVGVPNPMVAADVVDEDGRSLRDRPGEPARSSTARPWSPPATTRTRQATREAFRGGWFHSGDICIYDEDGLRMMVDRSKDIVKSGGENVSSLRVEAVLRLHPAVARWPSSACRTSTGARP